MRRWLAPLLLAAACKPAPSGAPPASSSSSATRPAVPPASSSSATRPAVPPAPSAPMPDPHVLTLAPSTGPADTLVVLLHGVGADAASFHEIARELAPALPRAELVTVDGLHPWDGGGAGRQWFSLRGVTDANRPARVRAAGEEVSRYLDAELDRRGLGRDRLVLVGFSQGAIVSAWLAVHREPRPRAALLFSGRVADDGPVTTGAPVPVFLAHGASDPVIPVAVVEPAVTVLEAHGARVTRHVYPGLDHRIDSRELDDARAFLAALR